MKKEFNAEVDLLSSKGGVYEVAVDGRVLFSKKKLNRFPEEGEIARLLRENE